MDLAPYIDHTLLKPDMTFGDVDRMVEEALVNRFAAVCVPPFFAQHAVQKLEGKDVKVATVVGFPLGYSPTSAKVEEVKNCIDKGVDEIDAVVNIAAIKNAKWAFVTNDIKSIATSAHMQSKVIKLILETSLLTEDELKKALEICVEAEVDFVKTSTGFNGQGVNIEVLAQMRSLLPETIRLKASGGIRTREFALALVEAGADRIGTSSGLELIKE